MITARKITDSTAIEKIVRYTFSGDDMLFQKYHLINNDREKAMCDTLQKIADGVTKHETYVFYVLEDDSTGRNVEIGYFCGIGYGYIDGMPMTSLLHSFGINVTFRKKENIQQLFELAKASLGGQSILCALYEKNTRAVHSCKLSGFEVAGRGSDNGEPYVILKSGKEHANKYSSHSCGDCIDCGRCESAV